jgi:hypothetical protein
MLVVLYVAQSDENGFQGFQVPVGVPIAMAEAGVAGHHVVGGDVWETQSNMTELLDGDNSNIPVGIAIEP